MFGRRVVICRFNSETILQGISGSRKKQYAGFNPNNHEVSEEVLGATLPIQLEGRGTVGVGTAVEIRTDDPSIFSDTYSTIVKLDDCEFIIDPEDFLDACASGNSASVPANADGYANTTAEKVLNSHYFRYRERMAQMYQLSREGKTTSDASVVRANWGLR